ncbi:MAG: general secretion pathway protein GspB [Chloroflexota bacterium]
MRIRLIAAGMLLLCNGAVHGSLPEINVSGTMQSQNGQVALINGRLFHMNDEISEGVRITAIDEQGITVSHKGKATNYLVANSEPPKSGLTEKIKSSKARGWLSRTKEKFRKLGWGKRKSEKKKSETQGLPKPGSKALKLPGNVSKLALPEKMYWADRLYINLEKRSGELAGGPLQKCTAAQDFMKVWGRYSKMTSESMEQFNKLELPCPETCPDNSAYIQWSEAHRQRLDALLEKRNEEFKAAADKLKIEFEHKGTSA